MRCDVVSTVLVGLNQTQRSRGEDNVGLGDIESGLREKKQVDIKIEIIFLCQNTSYIMYLNLRIFIAHQD